MSSNEIDDMSAEFRQLGHAAASAVAQWQRRNPGKTKVPRRVRKDATRRLRDSMRAHEQLLKQQRAHERDLIEQSIEAHRYWALEMYKNPGTPEHFASEQWEQAKHRHTVTHQIHQSQHLTREERGQAVMALVSAHYADNPRVKQRPVWGQKPYGISALKARLAERVSRTREGLAQRLAPQAPQMPRAYAAPGSSWNHPYWSSTVPPQDQAMNARMAEMEEQLRELAGYREREQAWIAERDVLRTEVTDLGAALTDAHTERDQAQIEAIDLGEEVLDAYADRDELRTKVTDLGEKVLDTRRQHRDVADQLAQRGQELTDAHTELTRVRGERDEAVHKLAERTPAVDRHGSLERQAEQAKVAARTAPETPRPPEPSTPKTTEAPETSKAPERDLVGASARNSRSDTQRINGSRKVINTVNTVSTGHTREQIGVVIQNGRIKTPASSLEIPLPDEPFDGPEPPEFDR